MPELAYKYIEKTEKSPSYGVDANIWVISHIIPIPDENQKYTEWKVFFLGYDSYESSINPSIKNISSDSEIMPIPSNEANIIEYIFTQYNLRKGGIVKDGISLDKL